MYTEEKIILTFIYKRSGKEQLSITEIYLPLSIELGWYSTTDAQLFIQHCLKHNLLKQTKKGIQPAFDIAAIQIPNGFTPKKPYNILNTKKKTYYTKNIYQDIIQTIASIKKISLSDIEKELRMQVATKNIHHITAAFLYTTQHHITLEYDISDIEQAILQENAE